MPSVTPSGLPSTGVQGPSESPAERRISPVSTAAPRPPRALLAALVVAASVLTGFLFAPGDARAARGMELAIQDDALFVQGNKRFKGNKAFDYERQLGVTRIRVNQLWAYTMPRAQYRARRKPASINYSFTQIDELIDRAAANGIRVHLSLTGPAPRWANAKRARTSKAWFKPNAVQFGKFARVAAQHFKGRVDRYSIWNEPNWKTWLGPLKSAPSIYRAMYVRAYSAIKKADRRAKVLIGETSPYARPGLSTAPLAFLRKMACVNSNYRRVRKCPKLKADGYAHHPYDFRHAPNFEYPGADNVTIGTRSRYLKQAYSIALRNGRVKSQMQYLMLVLPRGSASTFNTGLVSRSGKRLPQFNALRSWYRSNRGRVKRPGRAFRVPPAQANPVG